MRLLQSFFLNILFPIPCGCYGHLKESICGNENPSGSISYPINFISSWNFQHKLPFKPWYYLCGVHCIITFWVFVVVNVKWSLSFLHAKLNEMKLKWAFKLRPLYNAVERDSAAHIFSPNDRSFPCHLFRLLSRIRVIHPNSKEILQFQQLLNLELIFASIHAIFLPFLELLFAFSMKFTEKLLQNAIEFYA